MSQRALIFFAIAVVTAIYPVIIYFGLNHFGPRTLALIFIVALFVRAWLWEMFTRPEKIIYVILVGGLCLFAAWIQSEQLLRYYPVLMNFAIASFFAVSLFSDKTLIERFASVFERKIDDRAKIYMTRLTIIWALILSINGVVSFYTACCLSLQQWAIYNGVIAYIIFIVISLMELLVRRNYKKRYASEYLAD